MEPWAWANPACWQERRTTMDKRVEAGVKIAGAVATIVFTILGLKK